MTTLELTLVPVDVVLWAALLAVHSVRPQRSSLSERELKRRVEQGDRVAEHEAWRAYMLPRIEGLKWLLESILLVALTLVTINLFGILQGGVLSVILLATVELVSRVTRLDRLIQRLYGRKEPGLLKRLEGLKLFAPLAPVSKVSSIRIGSREELADLVSHMSPQIISRDDRTMLLSELEFSQKTVADIMTPRTMIDSVNVGETIGPLLLDRLHHTGHSRFPVIEEDIDHVVGMLYLNELIGAKSSPTTVRKAQHDEVYYIGEGRDLEHALHAFLLSRHHLFIVVNEYRETVGLLSLEDVIEALIGRSIVDEFDAFDDLRSVASANPKSNNAAKGKKDI
jgi:hypothetical protein